MNDYNSNNFHEEDPENTQEENIFDLKDFRENKLKKTQEELAELLGVGQEKISRLEKNPEQIPLGLLRKMASVLGMTLDQMLQWKKLAPPPLKVENTWSDAERTKKAINDYIDQVGADDRLKELQDSVNRSIKKPKLAIAGRSDAGKSTVGNALLGKNIIPTSWTRMTTIITYFKHIDDRPEFMKDIVQIFKKGSDGSYWDVDRLYDEEYCKEWGIASGGIETLAAYGTHDGAGYKTNAETVGTAVVFVSSDFLKNCDLIDMPGYVGGKKNDNAAADAARVTADVLVYLSQATSFLGNEDFACLKNSLQTLSVLEHKDKPYVPKLANLFIVASQAHHVDGGSKMQLKRILDSGCDRFYSTLTEKFWADRTEISGLPYTEEDLRKRFFTYAIDYASVREDFEKSLCETIEIMPRIIKEKAVELIKAQCDAAKKAINIDIQKYRSLIDEREECQRQLDELEEATPAWEKEVADKEKDVLSTISTERGYSCKQFRSKYNHILSEEHIVHIIDKKGYSKDKEHMQQLASYLNSELAETCDEILRDSCERFSEKVNAYIEHFEIDWKVEGASGVQFNMNSFNAKRAFASGLAGMATLGGLAFWASSLGNLGAYILVAKGVSLLATLGISVGGTAAAISAVAAIGGPIVLGIALSIVAAIGAFGIFSGGWKAKLAKKIRKAYDKENTLEQYLQQIDKFWDESEDAFHAGAASVKAARQEDIDIWRDFLSEEDDEKLRTQLEKAQESLKNFEKIPV